MQFEPSKYDLNHVQYTDIIPKFGELMSHLNSEDNDMAFEFEAQLQALEKKLRDADKRLEKLDALEAGGVDNWSGYGDCFEEEDDE